MRKDWLNFNMKNNNLDSLLKAALSRTDTPDAELVQKVKYKLITEEPVLKKSAAKRSFRTAAVAVMAFALITTTAFAAWYFLKPSEVADHFKDYALSAAFESETAVNINASVTSGDYTFTLLAIVTGKDITDMPYYSEEVQDERTYVVVAIRNADGTPMPDTKDDKYGQTSFFASPLVKGLNPARVNALSMNGGYSETVVDGILYRIVECDGVAMFADRGLYFAICTDTFYDKDAFIYNEQTGEIKANPNYNGASAVFDLPIDKSLADPEKAEQYLENMYQQPDEDNADEVSNLWDNVDWDKTVPVASTVKELTVDTNGKISYTYDFEYGSGTISTRFEDCFVKNQKAQSVIVSHMASDDKVYAVRFSMDEKGTITGAVVKPE